MLFDCLRGGVVRNSRAYFRAQFPIYSLCTRSDQSCCCLATTTQPRVAALRALINKQHNQASRVALCFSFDQNMPRAPHGAPVLVLGPQGLCLCPSPRAQRGRESFGAPEPQTTSEQNDTKTGALIRGARFRSGSCLLLHCYLKGLCSGMGITDPASQGLA
jgi:hypothetical protein